MKLLHYIAMLFLLSQLIAIADVDPAGDAVRPVRDIAKLPSAITHKIIDAERHQYTVSGLYLGYTSKQDDPEEFLWIYRAFIPDVIDFDLDFQTLKATFLTSRQLSLSELAYAIDDMAALAGDIPYWSELDARDLEDTEDFVHIRYEIAEVKNAPPDNLAWFWIPDDQVFKIPFSLSGLGHGSLLIVPSTSYCMCHARYTLRILDPNGMVIWKHSEEAYGSLKIALTADDHLDFHQVWMHRDDHGTSSDFVIRRHTIQE